MRRASLRDEVVEGDDVAIPVCGVRASPNAVYLEPSSLGSSGGVRPT